MKYSRSALIVVITLATVPAAHAQQIIESKDAFAGTVSYSTTPRSVKFEKGALLGQRAVQFSFHAGKASPQNFYWIGISTSTAEWIFIEAGPSLLLKLDGGEIVELSGDGSAKHRDVSRLGGVSEYAGYVITIDQLRQIAAAKTVDFRIVGSRRAVTGGWKTDLLEDARAMAAKDLR